MNSKENDDDSVTMITQFSANMAASDAEKNYKIDAIKERLQQVNAALIANKNHPPPTINYSGTPSTGSNITAPTTGSAPYPPATHATYYAPQPMPYYHHPPPNTKVS